MSKWCLKCQAKNTDDAPTCLACGESMPPTPEYWKKLAKRWHEWKYVLALVAGGAAIAIYFVVDRSRSDKSVESSRSVDRSALRRQAAENLDRRLSPRHSVHLEHDTVLAISGVCEDDELDAIRDRRVMEALSNAGITSVECGASVIPVR